MNSTLNFLLLFSAGFLLQSLLTLREKFVLKKFLKALVISLFLSLLFAGAFFLKHVETKTIIIFSVFAFAVIFAFLISYYFEKSILPEINEQHILQFNIVFLYTMLLSITLAELLYLKVIFLIFSAYAITHIFLDKEPGKLGREILYGWFLVMIFTTIVINFFMWIFSSSQHFSPVETIFGGMIFFMLLMYWFYVQRFMREPKFNKVISSKYSTVQLSKRNIIIIIVAQGGILIANYVHPFVSDTLLINGSLIIFPLIMDFLHKRERQKSEMK